MEHFVQDSKSMKTEDCLSSQAQVNNWIDRLAQLR